MPFILHNLISNRGSPRLISIASDNHSKTIDLVRPLSERGVKFERWGYSKLFSKRVLPSATYIFTDFERLAPWHIEIAGRIYAELKKYDLIVLNNPLKFLPRWALLRQLKRAGINSFSCWLPVEGDLPDKFPAFLRTIQAHRGVESGLLYDKEEASRALEKALLSGKTISDLVFIEYAAEPTPDLGRYRKYACYGVGTTMIKALTVTDTNWVAKNGIMGAARDEDYAQDLAEHYEYPDAELMRRVFEIAGMEFGRIDYGFVNGRPQIYELNTNPWIRPALQIHPNADRRKADEHSITQLCDRLAELAHNTSTRSVSLAGIISRSWRRSNNFGQP